ncbi:hypothetical protein H072_10369 [Dactylellina haptotyla CBS 200.50]|uniref:Superoxide dismutase copper/zinc binding domain-containing protein n=1 Tax=Dactylellina haptotyla (strain CBS 200.50) TaxID=1284197 RepID=S8BAK6_DACHA|nr:hypothetical protein H072_10369 [Dactylellina haptotyla CBS 200.50]
MHFSKSAALLAVAAGASVVSAADAPETQGNAATTVYEARFSNADVGNAYLNFTGTPDGVGVLVTACFGNIVAAQAGPYPYHIHQMVVPADNNCTATGGHLDPYMRTDEPPCDANAPQTCEVGDLSGKHGKIPLDVNTAMWCTSYVDKFLSLKSDDQAFIGNSRSIVVHNAEKVRLACGNIVAAAAGGMGASSANTTTTPGATSTGGPAVSTGAAGRIGANALALGGILGVAAMLF